MNNAICLIRNFSCLNVKSKDIMLYVISSAYNFFGCIIKSGLSKCQLKWIKINMRLLLWFFIYVSNFCARNFNMLKKFHSLILAMEFFSVSGV